MAPRLLARYGGGARAIAGASEAMAKTLALQVLSASFPLQAKVERAEAAVAAQASKITAMSDTFRRLMVRMVAAKGSMASASSRAQRVAISAAQRSAMMEHLTQAAKKLLSREETAKITDALCLANLEEDDFEVVAKAVAVPTDRRRDGQNFLAWMAYLSQGEWDAYMSACSDQVAVHFLVDVLLRRMTCVNPNEFTKKSVVVASLARNLTHPSEVTAIPLDRRIAIQAYVQKRWKSARRGLAKSALYVKELPATPQLCQAQLPEYYAAIVPKDGFSTCPLSDAVITSVDALVDCRNHGFAAHSKALVVPQPAHGSTADPMAIMQQVMLGLVAVLKGHPTDAREPEIRINRKPTMGEVAERDRKLARQKLMLTSGDGIRDKSETPTRGVVANGDTDREEYDLEPEDDADADLESAAASPATSPPPAAMQSPAPKVSAASPATSPPPWRSAAAAVVQSPAPKVSDKRSH